MHVADLLDPLLRRMVRRVRGARHVVDEERLVGGQRVDLVHVRDRLVGHRGDEVEAGIADERVDVRGVAGEVRRLPLAGVPAHEAVEVLEAHAGRPLVERADRTRLERRRVVVLAEPRRAIAVVLQDLADRRLVPGDEAVVARIAGRLLGHHAESDRVVVAAGDQRRARGRAQRRRVEVRVAQAAGRDPVQCRRRDHAAERARDTVPRVVGHDEEDVRRTLGRLDARRPVRLRSHGRALDLAAESGRRRGDLVALDGRRRAGRARHAGDLLRKHRPVTENGGSNRCGQCVPYVLHFVLVSTLRVGSVPSRAASKQITLHARQIAALRFIKCRRCAGRAPGLAIRASRCTTGQDRAQRFPAPAAWQAALVPRNWPTCVSAGNRRFRRNGVADGIRTHDNWNHNPGLYR